MSGLYYNSLGTTIPLAIIGYGSLDLVECLQAYYEACGTLNKVILIAADPHQIATDAGLHVEHVIIDDFPEIKALYFERYNRIDTEELKALRSGWNNPRKIALPKYPLVNNMRKLIRNSLPAKEREYHSH